MFVCLLVCVQTSDCTAHSDQKRAPDPLDTGIEAYWELFCRC